MHGSGALGSGPTPIALGLGPPLLIALGCGQVLRERDGDARNATDHLEGISTGESRDDREDAGAGHVDEREPTTTTTVAVRRPHEDDSDRDEIQIYFTFEKQITG